MKDELRRELLAGAAAGVQSPESAPGGAARVAWFKDPDGNLLSVSEHPE